MGLYTVDERERVRARVLELAAADERLVGAAVVGSLVSGGDRWSDVDLTFAVADDVPLEDVLDDWTRLVGEEFEAVRLFDVTSGPTIYRVFLLPDCLQVDLSFTPAAAFGAAGPKFELLFGEAVERPYTEPPPPDELFGTAVHHALYTRVCVERGRYWAAEHWLAALRAHALALACRRRGLPARFARGFDDLPADVLDAFAPALARSLEREELLRGLRCAVQGLLREADEVEDLAARVEPQLGAVTAASDAPEWAG